MQHVLITGCSSGIGLTSALQLAAEGYRVYAGIRKESDAAQLHHPNIQTILLDVADPASIQQAFEKVSLLIGAEGLHGLINNAGIIYATPFETYEEDKLEQMFAVNLYGPIRMSRIFMPLLQKSFMATGKRAKMIQVSSIGGAVGLPWEFGYHVSKFGVNGLVQSLSFELDPLGIDSTAVMPGGIKTRLFDKVNANTEHLIELTKGSINSGYYSHNLRNFAQVAKQVYNLASKPEAVGNTFIRLLKATKAPMRVRVGTDAKIMYFLLRLLPGSIINAMLSTSLVKKK
jgi:NAD(P)-dependent dehydrogenase (short-subunit alcohol dehydrogenase family)